MSGRPPVQPVAPRTREPLQQVQRAGLLAQQQVQQLKEVRGRGGVQGARVGRSEGGPRGTPKQPRYRCPSSLRTRSAPILMPETWLRNEFHSNHAPNSSAADSR